MATAGAGTMIDEPRTDPRHDTPYPMADRRPADPAPTGPTPAAERAGGRPSWSARRSLNRLRRDTAILTVVLAAAALVLLGLQQYRLTVLTGEIEPQMLANQAVLQASTDMESGIRGYQLSREPQFLQPYGAAEPRLREALGQLRAITDPDTAALAQDQQTAVDRWLTDVVTPVMAGTDQLPLAEAKTRFDDLRTANDALAGRLRESRDAVERQARLTTGWSAVLLGAVGLTGMVLLRRRTQRTVTAVVPPLEDLNRVVRDLDRGRTDVRADEQHGVAEIRAVATAVNVLSATNEQQRRALATQIALNDEVRTVSSVVRGAYDLTETLRNAVRAVAVGLRADGVWVRVFDGSGERGGRGTWAAYPPVDPSPGRVLGAGRVLALAAHRTQGTLLVSRTDDRPPAIAGLADPVDSAAADEIRRRLAVIDRESVLFVPIGVGPDCLGYLALARTAGRGAWSEPEREALLRIGRDLAQNIATARVLERERQLAENLRELDLRKDEFVSTASHELRTPLTAILGHIQLVNQGTLGPVPAALAPSIDAVDRNSVRLARLIDDLLALSRLEQFAGDRRERLDLPGLVRDVAALHELEAEGRHISLQVRTDEEIAVRGDGNELGRAVGNVISNAVKFSPSGGSIEISVRRHVNRAEIIVTDHGIGISGPDQQQLFTRFFRSTNPDALAIPGTGLGLTIIKTIAEKHGGWVDLRSELGAGTSVRMALPVLV